MSKSHTIDTKKHAKGVDPELKRWLTKRSDECASVSFVKHNNNDNTISFKYEEHDFTLSYPTNYPNHRLGGFCIDHQDDSLNWLGYVNLYCTTRNPTTLTKVLNKMDSNFCKYKQEDKPKYDSMDGDDLYKEEDIINSFDIEISRKKAKLYDNMKNCTSAFQLETSSRQVQMFKGDLPGSIILNEFVSLTTKYKNDSKVIIEAVDDNIYHWKLKFADFDSKSLSSSLESLSEKYGYNYLELDVYFHDSYYPTYPPVVKYIRPRLNKCLMHRLANLKMLKTDYWTPSRGMEFVVSKLRSILNAKADVNIGSSMNEIDTNPLGSYLELESYLMKLSAYCDDSEEFDELDNTIYKKIYNKEDVQETLKHKTSTNWAAGTGYGQDGLTNWDVNKYVALEKEKALQVHNILDKIVGFIQNHSLDDMMTVYNTIDGSYLISYIKSILGGASVLEMGKKSETFSLVFTILQNLTTEEGIFLFHGRKGKDGIIDILGKLYDKASKAMALMSTVTKDNEEIDADVNMMIVSLYEMAKPCYNTFVDLNKDNLTNNDMHNPDKVEEKNENDKYIEIMKPYSYGSFEVSKNKFYYEKTYGGNLDKKVVKRIAQEYTGMMDSLPTHKDATILFRNDPENLRVCRALVTGPDDTPYDSGVYIFDILFSLNYPNEAPSVKFMNHGGKRFNPNLYNCGKVCLSLLGTWGGKGGEAWNATTSTLYQVLNSIQSLILIPDPYYNEPGYESRRGTPQGDKLVKDYNDNIRLYTMDHAMSDMIERPGTFGGFNEAILNHFKFKQDYILKVCGMWVDEASYHNKEKYNASFTRLKKNLKEL